MPLSRKWIFERRRPPSPHVPPTKKQRSLVRAALAGYVRRNKLVPPLSLKEIFHHVRRINKGKNGFSPAYKNFMAIVLNNETWKDRIASIPFHRRLLLLPKCLRDEKRCPGEFDAIGLVCRRCGACPLKDLLNEAARLGYVSMIAEGSPVVISLIEKGKIDALIGVSCLSVLERVFPFMEAGAVPGIAVPLLNDGCSNTNLDLDWLWDAMHLTSTDALPLLNLDALRKTVQSWFTGEALEELLGPPSGETESIARNWLSKAGKRWRPFLTVCTSQALSNESEAPLTEDLKRIAIAVECFHKASLIHDDIEDADDQRYGEETLHKTYGVPIALNIGDFLIGEGYRLIAASSLPDAKKAAMLQVVSEGHRTLSIGQGAELSWIRSPRPLSLFELLTIFRQKTSPAFEVALKIGALHQKAERNVFTILSHYSAAIGTAYQIRDDIDDFSRQNEASDAASLRPSVFLALAYEKASKKQKKIIERCWASADRPPDAVEQIEKIIAHLTIEQEAWELLDTYKDETVRSLCTIDNTDLKVLLRRVTGKIFNELDQFGCCNDYQAGNVGGAAQGPEAVA